MKYYQFKMSESKFIAFVIFCTGLDISVLASYSVEDIIGMDIKGIIGLPDNAAIPQKMQEEKLLEKYHNFIKLIK